MARRNPMKDQVAIVGIGRTEYARYLPGKSAMGLQLEASKKAIEDAGLRKEDIDGICGRMISNEFQDVQEGLGIPSISWYLNTYPTIIPPHHVGYAASAVFSGLCDYALVCRGDIRYKRTDPLANAARYFVKQHPDNGTDVAAWIAHTADTYAYFAARYLEEFDVPRQVFGYLSVNNKKHGSRNPHAVFRTPITMEDYLNARFIREPLCLYDCDVPMSGGIAMVITTAERARELRKKPIYIHAGTFAQNGTGTHYYEQAEDYRSYSPWHVSKILWEKSDLQRKDMDIFFPYDGFTNIGIMWIEAMGYCGPGEAYQYLRQQWDEKEGILRLDGHTLVSTQGGSISAGADQGFHHFYEAVTQLRGEAGERQVPDCKATLLTPGGPFHNSTAFVLRAD